jgi:hypothetical protein
MVSGIEVHINDNQFVDLIVEKFGRALWNGKEEN